MAVSKRRWVGLFVFAAIFAAQASGQQTQSGEKPKSKARRSETVAGPDLTKQPTLYVVPYAHLDTQWRWEYPTVIREYLSKTMRDNFALFEKYPHYTFNFSGANRYRMMKEYYPQDFERLKHYVAIGRWFPSGSSMEENDVNNPSAESIIRQVLYGKEFFRREFGKTSAEYMLPDCFGFPASLPSILAHTGIKGFSTQKLSWHSGSRVGGPDSPEQTPVGIPFNVGVWEGTDGHSVIAALNAMTYAGDVMQDITKSSDVKRSDDPDEMVDWPKRVDIDGKASGVYTDFYYYGTGDTGGSPRESSVKLMEAILTKGQSVLPAPRVPGQRRQEFLPNGPIVRVGDGPLHVIQGTAEQMFLDIKPEWAAKMPKYKGDLELTEHSAGSLTSEAFQKHMNHHNELLADEAERAAVAAEWLGGRSYPLKRLTDAWTLVMAGQFHDIIPGTSTPKAYEFSWNDALLAQNQFAGVLTNSASSVASALNTQSQGTPLVVYNSLNVDREDVVEADATGLPQTVHVVGPDGKDVPAQVSNGKLLILAKVPSVGFAVYDVQSGNASGNSELKVSESSLENARYKVAINQNGDVSSIFDKKLNKEVLAHPMRLAFKTDHPVDWPAWNIDWTDARQAPRGFVVGPAKVRISENGPARIAVDVTRDAEGSHFVQTVRLAAGDAGNRVEFSDVVDWKTPEANLKAVFPLTASNTNATYNWDIGTIQRGNADEKRFEVASHQWFDLTDKSGAFGVTILTGDKNGSDKPDDSTLRLTLLRTPGIGHHDDGRPGNGYDYFDQTTQDWGHHEFVFGVASHAGAYTAGDTDWQGWRLNQPLVAFVSDKHDGALGKSLSLMKTSSSRIRALALKKAEAGDEYVVRVVELDGKPQQDVKISFAAPIASAREINGAEENVGAASVNGGAIVTSFTPYQPRTFAVKLGAAVAKAAAITSQPVTLEYDKSVTSRDERPGDGSFDSTGRAIPAELLPQQLDFHGVKFALGPTMEGKPNAIIPHGQTINLPAGNFNRIYILAAASDGDQKASFAVDGRATEFNIQDWGGDIGQWDTRTWTEKPMPLPIEPAANDQSPYAQWVRRVRERSQRTGGIMLPTIESLKPGFLKPAPVAWFVDHRHDSDGMNEAYQYAYLFAYSIPIEPGAKTLTLPTAIRVRILAISAVHEPGDLRPSLPVIESVDRSTVAPGFYGKVAQPGF